VTLDASGKCLSFLPGLKEKSVENMQGASFSCTHPIFALAGTGRSIKALITYAVSVSISRGSRVHQKPKFLCSAPGRTLDINTEPMWLVTAPRLGWGNRRSGKVPCQAQPPRTEKEPGQRVGWGGVGLGGRTRLAKATVRSRADLSGTQINRRPLPASSP
jgi:hypothetical protein